MKKQILDKWYIDRDTRVFEKQYPNGLFYHADIYKRDNEYRITIYLCKEHKKAYKYLIDGQFACNSLANAKMIHESVINSLTYLLGRFKFLS